MWTAKRILILVIGLLVTLSSFAVYSLVFGLIDGVQPLPPEYLPSTGGSDVGPTTPVIGIADEKLEQAFGTGCKELQRPLRLWLPDKRISFAAGECVIDKSDGKVRLAPFSAAIFHKSKTPGAYPEISTIRCDIAILTLDQPVSQFGELNNRKIIGIEMVGRQPNFITITNNRRTAEKNDDVDILITNGNVFYEEARDLIWTEGVVCLTDHQSKPPMVISGRGMDMHLAKEARPNSPRKASAQAAKKDNDNGNIERIVLRSDVDMKFWVAPDSGFLGGTPNTKKNLQPASKAQGQPSPGLAAPEKALIHIHTGGAFVYDLTKETAFFESLRPRDPKAVKGVDGFAPDQVSVERVQKFNRGEKFDQLTCDRLDLKFRRKIDLTGGNPAADSGDKEIETATATRRDVNEVTMSLDTQGMLAYGNEMFYRAGDATNGPLTILKGEPLRTAKDGHKMVSKELHLFAANRFGEGERAWAKGPGQIDLLDGNNPKKDTFPTHVLWRDTLTIVKEKEGGQVFDLITVLGEASFIEDLQKQELHGEKIMVWMLQVQESAKKPEAVGGPRQELHRVLAQDRVRAISPEFIVRKTNRLTMIFIPELASDARLPDLPPTLESKGNLPTPTLTPTPAPVPSVENQGPVVEPKKPKPPIELEGNEITVAVSTLGTKKQLKELIAKGNVYVFQAGEKKGEKSLDISGTLLTVKHAEQGDTMIVYGEKDKPARLEFGDSIIIGPRVTVNQADNRADVDGNGAMEMPSNKTIDGSETAKKSSRITIHWNKNMTFDGKYAVFQGGVQAHENGTYSRALCDVLTAILDKQVSFKDGQKDKQNAKIDRLVFDKNVFIEDYQFDDKKQPLRYSKLQGWVLINQEDGPTRVTGPGWVRLLAKGSADPGLAPVANAPEPAPAKQEWKLTHIKFARGMNSTSDGITKKTTFYGENSGVEVFHFPTVKIDDNMDPDRPKKDGLYLRCEMLTVEGKQEKDRTTQTMIAERNVNFRTEQYYGTADLVKYVENTDLVIFEGLNGNPVRLFDVSNINPPTINSSKVLYNRRTGKLITEGVKSIKTN